MPRKHIFGAQIENNMLENHADQREMVLLFSLLFFTLLQRARRSRVIFLQRLIARRAQRRRQAALLRVFTAFALQERRPRRIAWVLPRPQYWFENLLNSNALNMWWKENFQVTRETFQFICTAVAPVIQRQDTILRAAIPVETRTAIGLWRLAIGDSYCSCGLMFGIAKSTAIGVCKDFIQALCQLKDQFIKFPTCPAQVSEKIQGFREKSTFPNVVGAIDGTHIPIRAPKENHEDYFNRKHYYSFIVQGIVDASGAYLSVSTGFPGSMHDARGLRLSNFCSLAEEKRILTMPCMDINGTQIRPLILGNSAYPLKSWLMRPFQDNGALTATHRHFNMELSKVRIVVEHGFGQTKARWRCLDKRIDEDTMKIPHTVTACCVLQNICILMNDDFDGHVLNNHLVQYVGDDEFEANDIRQAIVDYLF